MSLSYVLGVRRIKNKLLLSIGNTQFVPSKHHIHGGSSFQDINRLVHEYKQIMDSPDITTRYLEVKSNLEAIAKQGHVESQYLLGILLSSKTEIEKVNKSNVASNASEVVQEIKALQKVNRKEKIKKKKNASTNSITSSSKDITEIPIQPAIELSPTQEAIHWLKMAVLQKHSKSMCLLANLLLNEVTTESSPSPPSTSPSSSTSTIVFDPVAIAKEAVHLYTEAAEIEETRADALFNLGTLHYDGLSVAETTLIPADPARSFHFYLSSANASIETAKKYPDHVTDPTALFYVGHCYATGENGCPDPGIDPNQALYYLRLSAEWGHPKAYYHLATLYRSGLEMTTIPDNDPLSNRIPVDKQKFREYLQKAVAQKDEDALFCLADIKLNGFDDNKNDSESKQNEKQKEESGFLARNEKEAVSLYEDAAELGHVEATVTLAALHYHGMAGLNKNPQKAFQQYNIAAENGSIDAWRNLASMYYLGDGVDKSEDTAKEIMRVILRPSLAIK